MAARTLGWAQHRIQAVGVRVGAINASTDTALNPTLYNDFASDRAANVWQVTAGQPVSIRWGGFLDDANFGGAAGNSIAWNLRVFYETQGVNLWDAAATDTFTQAYPSTDWTLDRTLTFTPTKTGTVRLYVEARVYVTSTGTTVAQINSDGGNSMGGSGQTFPGVTVSESFTPGLVRCGTALSSLAPSGFTGGIAAYPDTVSLAFTTGHAPRFADGTYTVSWRSAADVEFQSSTIAAGTVTALPAVTDAVDDSWPSAPEAIRVRLTPSSSALSTALGGAALPWVHFTSVPSSPGTVAHDTTTQVVTFTGAFTADARVTAQHHFQVDDDVFGVARNEPTKQMLSTQSGFIWTRIVNARGEGQNGLTVSQTLDPVNPGTTVGPTSSATATRDGQVGWSDRLDWTAAKPGGSWVKTVDVTAPATIDANGHLAGSTDTLTMLNTDPRIQVMVRVGPEFASAENRHLSPGDAIKIAVCPFNRVTRKKLTPDAAPTISLIRYTVAGGWEFLSSAGAWTDWATQAADSFTTVVDPVDTDCWAYTVANTSGWDATDLVAVQVTFTYQGTPYGFYVPRELVGMANAHDGYRADGPGFVGFPTR